MNSDTDKDEEDAVRIANDSCYGLAAGIWTENMARAHRTIASVKAGTVWVNTYRAFSTLAPFGGYKHSENKLNKVSSLDIRHTSGRCGDT